MDATNMDIFILTAECPMNVLSYREQNHYWLAFDYEYIYVLFIDAAF